MMNRAFLARVILRQGGPPICAPKVSGREPVFASCEAGGAYGIGIRARRVTFEHLDVFGREQRNHKETKKAGMQRLCGTENYSPVSCVNGGPKVMGNK